MQQPIPDRRSFVFLLRVLRGQAQVDFLPSAPAGLVFTVALCAAGWEYGVYGLCGTALGTATAQTLGVARDRVTTGLEGFNSCLVAVGFAAFLGADHLSTALLAAGGCVVVTVLTGAVGALLRPWRLPTLTLPYCLTASAMTIAAPGFTHAWHHGAGLAALARPAAGRTALTWTDLWHAFFANVAQIFFMPQWYVGALFLLGIFVADRRLGALACLGSAVGIVASWLLGAPATQIADGGMGYNAVLVTMALGGVFLATGGWSLAYAVTGAAAATILTSAAAALFAPSGGHTFTWPFVLTTLAFLVAVPAFPRLRKAGAPDLVPAERATPPAAAA
ncbi:urea transporter [Streptomyces niger]|uniref:urea transporter n=1 Tax=Streptomyces niger TaxID=66373 RepID=UPI000ACEF9DB|nr:urea transporter [Streptomyces niger]